MMMPSREYISRLLFFAVLAVVLAAFILGGAEEKPAGGLDPGCSDGASRACTKASCSGTQVCEEGAWSACSWNITCQPGSIAPCEGSVCADFYRVCNSCGSGYGPCIQSGKVS